MGRIEGAGAERPAAADRAAVSAYDKFLAEIRTMQASLDRMADLLTLIAPGKPTAPSPVTEWSCGHGHATRDEAAACLQEQRRAAAASSAAASGHYYSTPTG
jgi:hypothetical protein